MHIMYAHVHSPACYVIIAVAGIVVGRLASFRPSHHIPSARAYPCKDFELLTRSSLQDTATSNLKLPGGPPMMSTTGQRAVHKCWYEHAPVPIYTQVCVCLCTVLVYTKQTSPGTEATQKRTPPHSSECRKQPDGPAMTTETTMRPPTAIYDFFNFSSHVAVRGCI